MFITMKFFSETLGKNTEVYVCMPQKSTEGEIGAANHAAEKYKCLYLLHGLSDDHTIWMRRTSIERYAADYGIAVVMPNGEKSFYTDMKHGDPFYTYIAKELPQIIADTFSISTAPEDTFIAGLSMGGYGAFKIALKEQGRYAAAAGLSPVGNIKKEDFLCFKDVFGDTVPDSEDILYLAENCKKRPRIFMSTGTEDFMYENNQETRKKFEDLGYDFTYIECPGTHEWGVWDKHIQDALKWMFN